TPKRLRGAYKGDAATQQPAVLVEFPLRRPLPANMDIAAIQNPLAQRVAEAMIEGFNRHYRNMRLYGQQAKRLFETAQWLEVQQAVRERIRSYDERVDDNVARLRAEFDADHID